MRMHGRMSATILVLVAVSALAVAAAPAAAAEGGYTVTRQTGTTFSLLTSRQLLTGATDDQLFSLSTTRSGAAHMPFAVHVYNHTYTAMRVSSNGNIQFGVCCSGGTTAFTNTNLPSSDFAKPALAVFWDDLFFDPADTSHFFTEGIYTKTTGSKPHRTFTVSWQGHSFSSESYFVLAQVRFNEGTQKLRFRYGASDAQAGFSPSETIGVQGTGGTSAPFTLVGFNPASPVVASGVQYTFTHFG